MSNTQQAIVEAAIVVFNEDYSAPLEKVAERAGVTRRTLHRYFTGREELLVSCEKEMQRSCKLAMTAALKSSDNPLTQLENMLYAGVGCGAKYSFLSKLHTRPEHRHAPQSEADCAEYDAMSARFRAIVRRLQDQGAITPHVTPEWVMQLFSAVVAATTNSAATGAVALQSLRQFAWFSFSKGIGL